MKDKSIIEACCKKTVDEGLLSCADAHEIALELGLSPLDLGHAVNKSSELRFYRCQLGLFGYGVKSQGTHRIIRAAVRVPDDLGEAISQEVVDGRISCASIWAVADKFKYPRLQVANMVEAMGLSIRPCQLGCF